MTGTDKIVSARIAGSEIRLSVAGWVEAPKDRPVEYMRILLSPDGL
jgi:hypothetical protein